MAPTRSPQQSFVSEAKELANMDMARIFDAKNSTTDIIRKTRQIIDETHDLLAEADRVLVRR